MLEKTIMLGRDELEKYPYKMAAVGVVCTLAAIFYFYATGQRNWQTLNQTKAGSKAVIVIDAGHGGFDPGKVGVANTLEKDINLAIAKLVKTEMESSGYTVYMTREEDKALCQGNEPSKKLADMKNRVAFIEEKKPSLTVSIHQNSFSTGTKGAQVFYYSKSEQGKKLATALQNAIRDGVGDDNHRVEKANDSYYMLKNVSVPLVIVECGFLSNPQEEALLNDLSYQKKMAHGICEGVENFLYK